LATLDDHGVDYIVVGGIGAQAHGATRATADLDCVPESTTSNLARLAKAMVALGAYLRVGGMSDEESRALPLRLDADMLSRTRVSTWMTDAGPLDILMDIPDRSGAGRGYADLVPGSVVLMAAGVEVRVAGLDDIVQSKEFAGRSKDHEALDELRALRDGIS
jgi:hypothetical protein